MPIELQRMSGNEHHGAGFDGQGNGEAVDGGEGDPDRESDESDGVDEGGKDASTLVAEGLLVGGGTRLKVDGEERETDGKEIRGVVAGF